MAAPLLPTNPLGQAWPEMAVWACCMGSKGLRTLRRHGGVLCGDGLHGPQRSLHHTALRHWVVCLGRPLKALPLLPGELCLPACRPPQPLHANLDHRGGASESNASSWTREPAAQGHQPAVQTEYPESRPLPLSEMQQLLP